MKNNKLAILLARAGSKRLPNKNLQKVGNQTLLQRTITAALTNKIEIVVSSDSDKILELARTLGANTHHRSSKNSCDDSSSESAVLEVLNEYLQPSDQPEIILLPATSPLRGADILKNFLIEWEEKQSQGYDQAISVHSIQDDLWLELDGRATRIRDLHGPEFNARRSQDRKPLLVENSAIYVSQRRILEEKQSFIAGNLALIEIPKISAVDINEESDLYLAEYLLKLQTSTK